MLKILVVGDIHGAPDGYHHQYLAQIANAKECDLVFALGDFGFWEHTNSGVQFIDEVNALATETGIPWYAIDGNHDKTSLVMSMYGDRRTDEGFLIVRDNLFYVPRGCQWTWEGVRFMGFGGAYSVDKQYRLDWETRRKNTIEQQNRFRRKAGKPEVDTDTSGQQWFPEEEATDEEVDQILSSATPIDVLFTHDKPRGSSPGWNRKDLPECLPNQDRIQRIAATLTPKLLMHGHLHYKYNQMIRIGDDDTWLDVYGLDCDSDPDYRPGARSRYKRSDSWAILVVDGGEFAVEDFVQ